MPKCLHLFGVCLFTAVALGYHKEEECKSKLESSSWRPIRIRYFFAGQGINKPELAPVREEVLPALQKYFESALLVRDTFDEVYVDRICQTSMFGVCVAASNSSNTCGIADIEDTMNSLDVFDCPPGAHRKEDCAVKQQFPHGKMPLRGADLYIYISAEAFGLCRPDAYVGAFAIPCSSSVCGRPNVATVNLCPHGFGTHSIMGATQVLLHELVHTLGFAIYGKILYQWISETGKLQIPSNMQAYIIYEVNRRESSVLPSVSLLPSFPVFNLASRDIRVFGIPYHVIKSIDGRGFGKSTTCGCVTDPWTHFTEKQFSDCMVGQGLQDCILVVHTPKVLSAASKYYNCPSLEGMELENQNGSDGGAAAASTIYNSHWKFKNLQMEIMNPSIKDGVPHFVSPMTLAFLEDSGWYKVNYAAATTTLVKGATFGYQEGCALLKQKCVGDDGSVIKLPLFTHAFEKTSIDNTPRCSPDGIGVHYHTSILERNSASQPIRYQYQYYPPGGKIDMLDYCPAYMLWRTCSEVVGLERGLDPYTNENFSHRCSHVKGTDSKTGKPMFGTTCDTEIHCLSNTSYDMFSASTGKYIGECKAKNQEFQVGSITVLCLEPSLVCTKRNFHHIPFSDINRVPHVHDATERRMRTTPKPPTSIQISQPTNTEIPINPSLPPPKHTHPSSNQITQPETKTVTNDLPHSSTTTKDVHTSNYGWALGVSLIQIVISFH